MICVIMELASMSLAILATDHNTKTLQALQVLKRSKYHQRFLAQHIP